MPQTWLRFTARAIITAAVDIKLNLDDIPWDGEGDQPDKPIIVLRPVGGGPDITDLNNVPVGDYYIVVIDAGREDVIPEIFSVGPGNSNERTINYYTLTLEGDAGIGALTGAGRYRAGTSVQVSADVLSGHAWQRWIELGGGAEFNSNTRTWTLTMPARPLTLRATTSLVAGEKSPQTGDTRGILIPILIFVTGVAGLTGVEIYRRRTKKTSKK